MSSALTASLQALLAADATLTASVAGGVWVDPAPDAMTQPFLVLEQTFGTDTGYGGGPRQTTVTYEVSAVAPASSVTTARTAAARVDVLLDYKSGLALTGFRVLGCRRTAPIDEHLEEISGRWVRLGGEYTLQVEVS